MHRSGTSALASLVESMGISLGNKTSDSDSNNPKGYFENKDIVKFNENLLQYFNSRWDDPSFNCSYEMELKGEKNLNEWVYKAAKILNENFINNELAIKDPRLSILLPFWQKVFPICNILPENLYYTLIFRHPYEVAHSQKKRNKEAPMVHPVGQKIEETIALWFNYNYRTLQDSKCKNTIVLSYKNLVESTNHCKSEICTFLKINNKITSSTIESNLYRNKSSQIIENNVIKNLYSFLKNIKTIERYKLSESIDDMLKVSAQICNLNFRFFEKYKYAQEKLSKSIEYSETLKNKSDIVINQNSNLINQNSNQNSVIEDLRNKIFEQSDKLIQKHENENSLLKSYVHLFLQNFLGEKTSYVVYGAGSHTHWILTLISCHSLKLPIFILDDSPKIDKINKVKVIKMEDFDFSKNQIDYILVSSDAYHQEMTYKISLVFPDITILNPYQNLKLIPFSKKI